MVVVPRSCHCSNQKLTLHASFLPAAILYPMLPASPSAQLHPTRAASLPAKFPLPASPPPAMQADGTLMDRVVSVPVPGTPPHLDAGAGKQQPSINLSPSPLCCRHYPGCVPNTCRAQFAVAPSCPKACIAGGSPAGAASQSCKHGCLQRAALLLGTMVATLLPCLHPSSPHLHRPAPATPKAP
jgi:hypothetical protein